MASTVADTSTLALRRQNCHCFAHYVYARTTWPEFYGERISERTLTGAHFVERKEVAEFRILLAHALQQLVRVLVLLDVRRVELQTRPQRRDM